MERSEYVENRLLRIGATPEYVGISLSIGQHPAGMG